MRKFIAIAFLLCVFGVANAQTTYTATVSSYTSVSNFISCPAGQTCENYTTSMSQSGSFTVSTPLAPNLLNSNIAAMVTSYSFSDGINTYSSTELDSRLNQIRVTTDGSGVITNAVINLVKWLSGANGSHVSGDRYSFILLGTQSVNNQTCNVVENSPEGDSETCFTSAGNQGASVALGGVVTWSSAVASTAIQPIPTLSEWAMIIMASLMAFFAIRKVRSQ